MERSRVSDEGASAASRRVAITRTLRLLHFVCNNKSLTGHDIIYSKYIDINIRSDRYHIALNYSSDRFIASAIFRDVFTQ
ncbi:hypothetical protein [Calothrix sp. NIES-2098]|uniref:hypothetical protein n=1 Tax=Calothrix sp. NIES-2098 TaxID=1954171 RepID=UPI0030D8848B